MIGTRREAFNPEHFGAEIFASDAVGFCREAAIRYSPGLQPWVNRVRRHALKVASETGLVGAACRAI